MPELIIGGIALVPVIVALVELAKALGMPRDCAPYVNAVLSVGGYAAVVFLSQHPEHATLAGYIVNALVIFLSAAGFYSTVKFAVRRLRG